MSTDQDGARVQRYIGASNFGVGASAEEWRQSHDYTPSLTERTLSPDVLPRESQESHNHSPAFSNGSVALMRIEGTRERVEIPVVKTVEKVITKIVEVPVKEVIEKTVEVIVEKIVEVPVEKIVERIVEKVIIKTVEVPVERIVERIVEVPVEVPVERTIEKIIEVPVQVVVVRTVERVKEVEVTRIVERVVEVPVERIVKVATESYAPRTVPLLEDRRDRDDRYNPRDRDRRSASSPAQAREPERILHKERSGGRSPEKQEARPSRYSPSNPYNDIPTPSSRGGSLAGTPPPRGAGASTEQIVKRATIPRKFLVDSVDYPSGQRSAPKRSYGRDDGSDTASRRTDATATTWNSANRYPKNALPNHPRTKELEEKKKSSNRNYR